MNAIFISIFIIAGNTGVFKLASYYGDHMVLQRAPKRAVIWGYAGYMTFNSNIYILFNNNI